MKLILTVDAIRPPLTGIGRYTWELATRIPSSPLVEECRYFDKGRWVANPVEMVNRDGGGGRIPLGSLASRFLRGGYRVVAPLWQRFVLRNEKAALFHSTNFYLPAYRGKTVVTIHDLSAIKFPHFHPAERVAHLTEVIPRVVRQATHLITDSDFTRRELIETFGIEESRITAVPLGITTDFQPRYPEETDQTLRGLGLSHGKYTLFVSTIEPRKNVPGLIRAYGRLEPALKREYPLVLVGHQGWNSQAVHEQIQEASSEGWLTYLGYANDEQLLHLFSGARLFAFPSWYEGFGLPVLQAMASGVPCVVSTASSLPEVCEGAGLMIDPADSDGWTNGIRRGLLDESWRQSGRILGMQVAAGKTWDSCVKKTIETYQVVAK